MGKRCNICRSVFNIKCQDCGKNFCIGCFENLIEGKESDRITRENEERKAREEAERFASENEVNEDKKRVEAERVVRGDTQGIARRKNQRIIENENQERRTRENTLRMAETREDTTTQEIIAIKNLLNKLIEKDLNREEQERNILDQFRERSEAQERNLEQLKKRSEIQENILQQLKERSEAQERNILEQLKQRSEEINSINNYITNLAIKVDKIQDFLELKFKENEILSSYSIQYGELKFKKNERGDRNITIGKGAFGNVYLGEYNGTEVAIKEIFLDNITIKKQQVLKEIELMLMIRHTNNCLIYGYVDDMDYIYIVEEYYANGDLFNILANNDLQIDDKTKRSWLLQIAKGMNYLHSKKILHRDLKSANIFLTNEYSRAVIGDFGLSKQLSSRHEKQLSRCGTNCWMAPEVIENQGKYNSPADVYSYGIVMYEVLTRCLPYNNIIEIETRVVKGERPDINRMNSNVDYKLILLMKRCWDPIPERRPAFSDIINNLTI